MNNNHNKVQIITRFVNLIICIAFLCISIKRVSMNQWDSYWIWIWGLLTLLNAVLLVIKPKDLRSQK